MSVLSVSTCISGAQGVSKRESDPPGSGVTDGYEPACDGWELNSGPLEEQQVFSTNEPFARFIVGLVWF